MREIPALLIAGVIGFVIIIILGLVYPPITKGVIGGVVGIGIGVVVVSIAEYIVWR